MHKRAIIVASGPSARGFVPPRSNEVVIIGVNGAHDWCSHLDHWFTLDLSMPNRKRICNRRKGTQYHIAHNLTSCVSAGIYWYERIQDKTHAQRGVVGSLEWCLWRYKCCLGLQESKGKISTGNSAYGALNLAYHLGCEDVALIGVDGTCEQRVEGGCSSWLTHLPTLFESAFSQINVVSCGGLRGIPRMSFEKWIGR